MMQGQLSLWLQPEPAAAAELDAVISRLAAVHGTATFGSHLTVLAAVEAEAPVAALADLAEQLRPLEVRFTETRCEHAWHRSLYLAAVPDPGLRRVFDAAVRAFEVAGDARFEPHLSLQYSELPVADKLRLAAGVALDLPRTVRFDTISLWQTPGSDAARWRLIASHSLPSGSDGRLSS